jgi:hypothetical protein
VEDTPNRWVPPVGEREKEERERWCGPRELLGRKGISRCGKKKGKGGEWAAWAGWGWVLGFGFAFIFFSFFQILFKQIFKPF